MFPRHKRKKQRGVHQSAGSGCLLFGQGADSRQQQPVCAGKNSFLRSQPTEIANVKVCDKKSLVEHCNFSQFTYLEQCCLCNLSSPLNFAVCIYGHFVNESFFFMCCRFSQTMVSSKVVLVSGAGLQVSCRGLRVWLSTPTVTSSLLTMTTNGSASFQVKASLR